MSQRRRQSVHQPAIRGAARRDRRRSVDRHRGRFYDNALAETVNGYYKAELIRGPARPGPWRTVDDVELATLGWVHWHNHQRLHGYLDDLPPVEFEGRFYATQQGESVLVEIK